MPLLDTPLSIPYDEVVANNKSALKILGPEIIGLLLVFAVILGVLNYFNILSLSRLYPQYFASLPHQAFKESVQTPVQEPIFVLKCPVPLEFCNSAEKVTYKGNPGLGYKLPDNTPITSIAPVIDSLRSAPPKSQIKNPTNLYQSYINNNNCYVVTYVLPYDTTIKKIEVLPLEKETLIATSGATKIIEYNLILQIQKRALDSSTQGLPNFKRCPVINLEPESYGTYEKITPNDFK